jgi:hypothetical protein
LKFNFATPSPYFIVCGDVGKITSITATTDPGGHSLFFVVGNKRYSAMMKPSAARLLGFVCFACLGDGGRFELRETPPDGIWEGWQTPRLNGCEVICADPRIVRAYILYSALIFTRKTEAEINAILADVPTRAEALEWLKANRFPTEPLDDEAAWKRVREAEDAREFEDYIFRCSQLKTEDF